jgi:hypothetical protein
MKGGKQPGAGNPGYGIVKQVKANFDKFSPLFWAELNKMIKSRDINDRKFALSEFNRIQVKMLPQVVQGDKDNPLEVNIYDNIQRRKIAERALGRKSDDGAGS